MTTSKSTFYSRQDAEHRIADDAKAVIAMGRADGGGAVELSLHDDGLVRAHTGLNILEEGTLAVAAGGGAGTYTDVAGDTDRVGGSQYWSPGATAPTVYFSGSPGFGVLGPPLKGNGGTIRVPRNTAMRIYNAAGGAALTLYYLHYGAPL